jgi:hypothetical protein
VYNLRPCFCLLCFISISCVVMYCTVLCFICGDVIFDLLCCVMMLCVFVLVLCVVF